MNKRQPGLTAAFFLLFIFCLTTAEAQQRFTVQSSGRGMENAKQGAQIRQIQVKDGQQDSRIDAVEGDIAKIAAHAWKTIAQCGVGGGASGTGYKITWNPAGTGSWGCIQETDPTVKAFAKTDLPSCGAGQVLRSNGTQLSCTTSAGSAGFEVDPYVQDFARNTAYTINACAADELLTMTNKRLRCIKSRDLSITELDPTVQPFAKAALPVCGAGQVLTTATGSGGVTVLRCVTDTDGGYAELDPSVGTITNTKWCMAASGKIHCNQNPPVLTETDPTVKAFAKANLPTCAAGKVLTGNGTALSCADAGATPGGANTHVQYNNNGSLAGDSGFLYRGNGRVQLLSTNTSTSLQIDSTLNSGGGSFGIVRVEVAQTGGGGTTAISGTVTGSDTAGQTGVYGETIAGRGVEGRTTSTTLGGRAVYGEARGPTGYGLYGYASRSTGKNYGAYGEARGDTGYGVYAYASSTSGVNYGLYARTRSSSGYGVYSKGRIETDSTMTATAYYQSSDRNLKTDIETITDPFALLDRIGGKHFLWKKDGKAAYGVIAQDVATVMPEAISENDEGYKTVEYSQLIAPLIEAVKQLENRVRELEAEKVQPVKAQPRIDHNEEGVFRLFNY